LNILSDEPIIIPNNPVVARQLSIVGIEVTQAIQYYRAAQHLTDPSDQGRDNSVRMVAYKPAWVRVYVRSLTAPLPNVTGTIEVEREILAPQFETVGIISPQPPGTVTAVANRDYDLERRTIGLTLNFIIPAEDMAGNLVLRVRVMSGSFSDERDIGLDVTLRQTLQVSAIQVRYEDADGTVLPPHGLKAINMALAFMMKIFPVQSQPSFRIAGTVTITKPLDDTQVPGICSNNWNSLQIALKRAKVNDGNRPGEIYHGLIPHLIPLGGVVGCGGCNDVSSSPAAAREREADPIRHEIGHNLCLSHAPCGTPPPANIDPNYPAYEPYDMVGSRMASIGEYGLDIDDGRILSPNMFRDIMSYCIPKWISLYHYRKLIGKRVLHPTFVGISPEHYKYFTDPNLVIQKWPPTADDSMIEKWNQELQRGITPGRKLEEIHSENLISIIGLLSKENKIEVHSVARLKTRRESYVDKQETELSAELVDKDGKVLATEILYALPSYCQTKFAPDRGKDKPLAPPYSFEVFLTDVASGATLQIRQGEEILWNRHAPNAPPQILSLKANLKNGFSLSVDWDIQSTGEQKPECWLQWSSDDGETWNGLGVGLTGKHIELEDVSYLPSGSVQLRLLANDGFYTSMSEPIRIEVPQHPPSVVIFSPYEGRIMLENTTLRLWGTGANNSGKPIEATSARWIIDGKEVARGFDIFMAAPSEGQHSCTLIVDSDGLTGQESTKFETLGLPRTRKKRSTRKL
jgi:hypothetical protein